MQEFRAVFYRPPSSDYLYLKEFTKFLDQASKAKFDHLLIVGDFNLPNVDWATLTASIDCQMYTLFTKAMKDHFLWQVIDFPTRNNNILDLLLTNIPDKISNIKGFQDILNSDHQLIEFSMDLCFEENDIIASLTKNYWSDTFQQANLEM